MESKLVLVFELTQYTSLEAEWGPIAPISTAIKLWKISRRRAYRWVQKGNLKSAKVWGQTFVPVTQPVILRGKSILLPLK